MQSFNISLGKTKEELQALTEATDLGAMIYDPGKKIAYEKEWHTIVPTSVIKPEIDGTGLDYYYNETKLKKNTKYCAQLYWKAGLVISDGTSSDMATVTTVVNSSDKRVGGVNFNADSGLVDTIFYTAGAISSSGMNPFTSKSFAISEELAQILDVSSIRETLKKIPALAQSIPSSTNSYLYSGSQSYITNTGNPNSGFLITNSSTRGSTPTSTIFGHPISGIYDMAELFKVVDDGDELQLNYSQPESNIDSNVFYSFSTGTMASSVPGYIKTYYPQALPIGVPMVVAPAFITTGNVSSSNLKNLVTPFIFYMLGVTETPEEA